MKGGSGGFAEGIPRFHDITPHTRRLTLSRTYTSRPSNVYAGPVIHKIMTPLHLRLVRRKRQLTVSLLASLPRLISRNRLIGERNSFFPQKRGLYKTIIYYTKTNKKSEQDESRSLPSRNERFTFSRHVTFHARSRSFYLFVSFFFFFSIRQHFYFSLFRRIKTEKTEKASETMI